MRITASAPLLLLLGGLLCVAGCDDGDSVSGKFEGGTGTLNVHLTDAPMDLAAVQSVTVTIEEVILYPQEDLGGPVPLLGHPATFDLLTLTEGATALLASGQVPAGPYSRIRLRVYQATLLFKDGTSVPLKLEPEKVDVPISFEVIRDDTGNVTLDFDAGASVQVNETSSGQWILRPVVTPVY
jgi:hypothetical protein